MNDRVRVLIVGAGRLGRTFEQLLLANGQSIVSVWDKDPQLRPGSLPLSTLARTAAVVFVTVPTDAVRTVVETIGPDVGSDAALLFFNKGLESATGLTAAEIAEQSVPSKRPWAVVGGPMMAEDLRTGGKGHAVVAGTLPHAKGLLANILPKGAMTFESVDDAFSVSMLGVLKNIYALAYGVGVGLGWSAEALTHLWSRCEKELAQAARICGVVKGYESGPAGIEDFRITAGCVHSRDRRAGEGIGREGVFDESAEGVRSFAWLVERFPDLRGLDCIRSLEFIFRRIHPPHSFTKLSPLSTRL